MKQTSLSYQKQSKVKWVAIYSANVYHTLSEEVNFLEVVTKNNLWSSGYSTSIVYLRFVSGGNTNKQIHSVLHYNNCNTTTSLLKIERMMAGKNKVYCR